MPKLLPTNQVLQGDCLELMAKLPSKSVDLVIGSPPYAGKGERYGTDWKWDEEEWVDWMERVTCHALHITKNVVVWVVNGRVDKMYHPACEGLVWNMYRAGFVCERPCIWHKNAPPNRRDWFGNDWEFCLAFRPDDSTRYFDWEAVAQPPKHKKGGRFRQRGKNGERKLGSEYPTNPLARPRDVFRVTVGGGHMGDNKAHLNEAPYPEGIVEPFLLTCCPPNGIVLDPFCGSGTTCAVAAKHNRRWIGMDVRESQVQLTSERMAALS